MARETREKDAKSVAVRRRRTTFCVSSQPLLLFFLQDTAGFLLTGQAARPPCALPPPRRRRLRDRRTRPAGFPSPALLLRPAFALPAPLARSTTASQQAPGFLTAQPLVGDLFRTREWVQRPGTSLRSAWANLRSGFS